MFTRFKPITTQSQLEEMQNIIDDLRNEIADFKRQISQENDALWGDVKDIRNDLSQDINKLEGDMDELSNVVHDINVGVADLEEIVREHTSDIAKLDDNLADLTLLK